MVAFERCGKVLVRGQGAVIINAMGEAGTFGETPR